MGKYFVVFLSWHNSIPGYIKKMYDLLPLNKAFISREHIKPPRLVDSVLMSQNSSYVENTDEKVLQRLRSINPRYVVVWNGDFNDNDRGYQVPLIKRIKKETNIQMIYCEHGWLPQSLTFSMDKEGSNGGSSFSNSKTFPHRTDFTPVVNKRRMYNGGAKDPGVRDFIYVPLQLNSDTQIKMYSPHFKDMADFITHIANVFEDKKLIIKGHPKDLQQNHARYKGICSKIPNATYVMNTNNLGYCKYADRVIAINSTTINEALVFQKAVMTYGKNNFYGKGVTYEVSDINDYTFQRNFLFYEPDLNHVEDYLCHLLSLQFDSTNPNMKKVLKHFSL